ncbi:Ran-binding protein [Pseudohyphozyma bogoriensis]|nr:Ran-binding protein [Pseudohyphozyma bogoriensis]
MHRTTPILAPPPPRAASGTNRLPVIARRRTLSLALPAASGPYSKPFAPPAYLAHSSYYRSFFTTPPEDTDLFGEPKENRVKLSEGLASVDDAAPSPVILLPTCWDNEDRCALIDVSTDALGCSFGGSAKYGDRDAAAVRANRPIPPQTGIYYFEVHIVNAGAKGFIGVGVSHRSVPLSRLPGWEPNSWGYHADDGFSFSSRGTGVPYGPRCTTGDVVGCGIDFTAHEYHPGEESVAGRCFFTKNGEWLGYAFDVYGKLYPSVGLRTPGEIIRANFGSEPFKYDIETLVRDRKRVLNDSVINTAIPPSLFLPSPPPAIPSLLPTSTSERVNETLQSLVSSYLIHHGYTSSASAFLNQIHEERVERSRGLVPSGASTTTAPPPLPPLDPQPMMSPSDSLARAEIRRRLIEGDVERSIALTQKHYPAVLVDEDDEGGMLFKLRLRSFVEGILRTSSSASPTTSPKGKAKALSEDDDVAMAPVEDAPSALDSMLELGRALQTEYGSDTRPKVQEALTLTFSLWAYEDPRSQAGPVGLLVSDAAREALADELNSAILVSQRLPPMPQLESMVRHANAAVKLLGDIGDGGAALLSHPLVFRP